MMRENIKFVLGLNIEGLKCGAKAKDCKCNSTWSGNVRVSKGGFVLSWTPICDLEVFGCIEC